MAALLRGYRPIVVRRVSKRTGKQYHYTQAYLTPRGNRISRREYDDRRLRRGGQFQSRRELEQFRLQVSGSDWLVDIRQHTGRAPTPQMYADWREVRRRRAVLAKRYPRLSRGRRDAMDRKLVAPDGPLARILDATGRRQMIPGVAVGES
jgi:hypothetical protein